jgi:exodeoxyribonuclease V alpha subunit
LLEYDPRGGGFQRNADNPLPVDLVVADEVSILDVSLARHLFEALPASAHLLLVGDVDQVPSVGPGNVLRDIIDSRRVAVVRLGLIFRQAEGSLIIANAHRINQGEFPALPQSPDGDFFFFGEDDPAKAAALIVDLVRARTPRKFGIAPSDIQVLSPMRRGEAGVQNLNQLLQAALNPPSRDSAEHKFGATTFRVGDRVMQIRNNYGLEVFNGDIGVVAAIDAEEQKLTVSFDGRVVEYGWGDVDELVLAYAATVHKSQGSEYPCVIMPLLTQHYMLLQRNLIYTGVTRAKKLVVVVGSKKALAMAVRNNKVTQRYSGLRARLAD